MAGGSQTDVFLLISTSAPSPSAAAFSPGNFSSAAAAAADGEAPADCSYEEPPLTLLRFWIVTVFGTSVALCSILENTFFFYLFSTRRHHRTSFNCYMMFIALFDVLISSSYIFLMSMNVLMDFLQSLALFRIWHYYMVPMITISHCAISSGSFLILAATTERFFLTANSRHIRIIQRNRKWIILFAICMGILSKVTICLEFKIQYREECANTMSEIDIGFADFVFATDYHLYFRFYYRNFVTIFFPFFALLFLNFKIIHVLAKFEKDNYQFQLLNSATATAKQIKRKKVTRAATITTILVVCTYLVSNIISVALTTWEHIDKHSLMSEYLQFYLISIDLTSFLVVTACAFRPLIYLICQPALRKEVFSILKRALHIHDEVAGDPSTRLVSAFEPMYNSLEVSTPLHQAQPVVAGASPQQRLSIPQVRRDSAANHQQQQQKGAAPKRDSNGPIWPMESLKDERGAEGGGEERKTTIQRVDLCLGKGDFIRSILFTAGNETLL